MSPALSGCSCGVAPGLYLGGAFVACFCSVARIHACAPACRPRHRRCADRQAGGVTRRLSRGQQETARRSHREFNGPTADAWGPAPIAALANALGRSPIDSRARDGAIIVDIKDGPGRGCGMWDWDVKWGIWGQAHATSMYENSRFSRPYQQTPYRTV